MLSFIPTPQGYEAVGRKGVYTIQFVAGHFVLRGIGHDGLCIPGIPVWGRLFSQADQARTQASVVDSSPVEAEASGG